MPDDKAPQDDASAPPPPPPSPYEQLSPWSNPPPPPAYGQPPPPPVYGPPPGYGQAQPPTYGQPQPYGYPASAPTSNKATTVGVLGIGSIVLLFTCGLGVIPAIIALAMAGGAKREIAQSDGTKGGLGLIKAGKICAWITIGLTVVAVVALVLILVALGATSFSSDFSNAA